MRGESRSGIRNQILDFIAHKGDPTLHEIIDYLRSLGFWSEKRLKSLAVYKDCEYLVREKKVVKQKASKRVKKRLRKLCADKERKGQIMRHTRFSYRLPRRRRKSADDTDSPTGHGVQDSGKHRRQQGGHRRRVRPGRPTVQRVGNNGRLETSPERSEGADAQGSEQPAGNRRGSEREARTVASSSDSGADEQGES